MSLTITVPLNNGDGSIASFELTLPVGAPAGKYAWTSSVVGTGTVTARNDGRSALFTPVAVNSSTATVITATVKNALGVTAGWQPGKLYFLSDTILDSNGHVQQVSAATKFVPTRYTPNAGFIPGSVSLVLTGGSAASSTGQVAITGISASVPSTFAAGQPVTIAGMTGAVASLNGTWTLLAVGANNITISYNGAAVSASVTAASTAYVPGDALISSLAEGDQGLFNGNYQYGLVLNQGQGTNGDWPAGAIAANSGNIKTPYPTSSASVSFTACGYSSGGSIGKLAHPFLSSSDTGTAGISTPVPIVPWLPYHNYALGFQIIDENGNVQQVLKAGTSGTQYPAFSLSSTTTDGTVTWKYISAATLGYSNVSVTEIAKYSEVGPGALGSFAVTAALNATTAGVTRYAVTGLPSAAASNGYAGYVFTVAGDTVDAGNNGVFICTASTTTYLYLANTGGVTHSFTGTAVNSGLRAYVDGAGLVHVGWVTQVGEVQFAEPAATTPAFSTGGGTVTDGDLTWHDLGNGGGVITTTTYNGLSIVIAAGAQPVPYNTFSVL
jgi:hypothetical protein